MSEWVPVLAVFWILWGIDGARLNPRRGFTWIGFRKSARARFSRLSLPGWWPAQWRATFADVPLSLSPVGVTNRPAGAVGRPAEIMAEAMAWRWEEIKEVGVARGWIFINGRRFIPDTGHLTAPQLLALAGLPAAARESRIRVHLARWFRPAHLARRAWVLRKRTALAAGLNGIAWANWVLVTLYVAGDVASRLPPVWSDRMVLVVAGLVLGTFVLHGWAIVAAWRALKRLPAVVAQKRSTALFSALLMPPQAMRLRSLLGDGYFPAQHPLAAAVAWGRTRVRDEAFRNVMMDVRWPIAGERDGPVAKEVVGWFGTAVWGWTEHLATAAQVDLPKLLAEPAPDAPTSLSYCPRCGDQFRASGGVCPNGVPLRPLSRR